MAFDTNINANSGALATKYGVNAGDCTRITQARLVWGWFMEALAAARGWAVSLTQTRDMMQTAPQNGTQALPGGPTLPPVPMMTGTTPAPRSWSPASLLFSRRSWRGSRITRNTRWRMASYSGSRARRSSRRIRRRRCRM